MVWTLKWIRDGLRKGIVTTRYPAEEDHLPQGSRGRIVMDASGIDDPEACANCCPTDAIRVEGDELVLDLGSCVFCGLCEEAFPEAFESTPEFETSVRDRRDLESREEVVE